MQEVFEIISMDDNGEILGCYASTATNAELDEVNRNIAFKNFMLMQIFI